MSEAKRLLDQAERLQEEKNIQAFCADINTRFHNLANDMDSAKPRPEIRGKNLGIELHEIVVSLDHLRMKFDALAKKACTR